VRIMVEEIKYYKIKELKEAPEEKV